VPIDLALAHQAMAIVVLTLAVLHAEHLVARRVELEGRKTVVPLGQPG
jgi:heme a synthase